MAGRRNKSITNKTENNEQQSNIYPPIEQQPTIEDALLQRMTMQIKTKQGGVAVDPETGQPLTATQAIAMSILQNAMHGDIASATFIRNITRSTDTKTEDEFRRLNEELTQRAVDDIRQSLEQEGLYLNQDSDILQLARQRVQLDRMSALQEQADFEYLITEYTKDGRVQTRVNPLIEAHDRLYDKYNDRMKELRTDAMRRRQNMKILKGRR